MFLHRSSYFTPTAQLPWLALATVTFVLLAGCEHGDNAYVPPMRSSDMHDAGDPPSNDAAPADGADEGPLAAGPVRGRVLDPLGRPLANVAVTIADTTVTTGAQGTFTLPTESAGPYDVELFASDGKHVSIFKGGTSRNPVFVLPTRAEIAARSAQIEVILPEPTVIDPAVAEVYFFDLDDSGRSVPHEQLLSESSTGNAQHTFSWTKSERIHAIGMAFRFERDPQTQEPIVLLSQARLDTMLEAGQQTVWQVTWSPAEVSETILEANVTPTEGHLLLGVEASVRLRPTSLPSPLFRARAPHGEASFVVPGLPGGSWDLTALTQKDDVMTRRTLRSASTRPSPVTIEQAHSSAPESPAEGALMGSSSPLRWHNPDKLPTRVTITPASDELPSYRVIVRDDHLLLPEHLLASLAVGSTTEVEWHVEVVDLPPRFELAELTEQDIARRADAVSSSPMRSFLLEREALPVEDSP